MKIYILRHEDRTQDCSFFSPLTELGLQNSIILIDRLKKYKINKIYSSPFIRTLQTIYPYVKEMNIKNNIEYGLEEINHEDIIAPKNAGVNLPEYLAEAFNYNPEYKSFIKSTDIIYPEKVCHVEKRIKRFLRKIITENVMESDINILLVTHMCVCTSILKIANQSNKDLNINLDDEYTKGTLALVFDSTKGWMYDKC